MTALMQNTVLSPTVEVEADEKVISILKSVDTTANVGETLSGKVWTQIVARTAFCGVPSTFEDAETKLNALEIAVRKEFAIPSARPGGKRSMGTGYKLHPLFKSYKSTLKGAFEQGVEILDAAGVPRSRGDVSEDIKKAKHVDKSDAEKFAHATDTWCSLFDLAESSDPLTVDAVNRVINKLIAAGYKLAADTSMDEAA